MLSTPTQDWHKVILDMLAQAGHPISPHHQPNVKLERVKELETMGCVDKVKGSSAKGFAYTINDMGRKYHQAMQDDTLFNVARWREDADLPILYLAYGDVREAIPHIIDGFNAGCWMNKSQSIITALRATDNGYAHIVADVFKVDGSSLSWVKPNTALTKHRESDSLNESGVVTINFQLSPLAEDAFTVIQDYMKRKRLRTHRQSGVASKGLAGEYALIVAASIIRGDKL